MYITFSKNHFASFFSSVALTGALAPNYCILNYLIIYNIFQKFSPEKNSGHMSLL
jgi:hypothetical protein